VLEVHRGSQKLQLPLAQLRLQQGQRGTLTGTDVTPALPGIRYAEVLVPAGSLLAGTSLRALSNDNLVEGSRQTG
jgi:hypothetical protein